MFPKSLARIGAVAALGVWLAGCAHSPKAAAPVTAPGGVRLTDDGGKVRIDIGGRLFSAYWYRDVRKPYLYPLLGPHDLPMTRDWPMRERPGEEQDHPHHRSLWFAHGLVNGQDFWSEEPGAGRIVHEKFLELHSSENIGVLRAQHRWVAKDGAVVCTDETTLRVLALPTERVFDYEVTLHASHGELTLGDTKEGTMALRLAESMRLTHGKAPGQGHIVNAVGERDQATWGRRADWCDYSGPVDGRIVGVAIFDHPRNPRHPTWWHVRDYGLFAANPFGVHDFEKKPAGTGQLKVPAGESVTFRYRFILHDGDEKQARLAERYQEYAARKN